MIREPAIDTEQALRMSEARLKAEATALARLNEASSRLWRMQSLREGLDEMLAATIELLGADMGNVQILDAQRRVLLIAAQRGFKQDFLEFFREVSTEDDSACGRALRSGERIIIEDVEADPPYAPFRSIARATGYRAVQSTPLVGRDGTPLGMLSTHFPSVHRPNEQDLRRLDLYARQAADFIERCRTDEELREREARRRAIVEGALDGIITIDHEGRIVEFNAAAERLFGYPRLEAVGRHMADLIIPPHLRDKHRRGLRHYLATGEASVLDRRLEMTALRRDGTKFPVELSVTRITIGNRPFFTGYVRDITDRKLAEDQQALFINELNHRVKNTLAIIQSIAAQTLRETPEPTAFNAAFSARLAALARAHSLLTRELWQGASLSDIVSAALAPFCGDARQEAMRINGQPILIMPNIAVTLTLVLHELATNAAKHGALTTPSGRISVEWTNTVGEPGQPANIALCWKEQGGPVVNPPKKRGYGSRLIAASADQLGGDVAVEYKPQGVEAWLRLPLPAKKGLSVR